MLTISRKTKHGEIVPKNRFLKRNKGVFDPVLHIRDRNGLLLSVELIEAEQNMTLDNASPSEENISIQEVVDDSSSTINSKVKSDGATLDEIQKLKDELDMMKKKNLEMKQKITTITQQSNQQMVDIVSQCQQQVNGSTETQDKYILQSAATKNKKTGTTTPKKGKRKKKELTPVQYEPSSYEKYVEEKRRRNKERLREICGDDFNQLKIHTMKVSH